MYSRSTEIIWILNMLLLNDKRPIIQTSDIFDESGNFVPDRAKQN